MQSAVTFGRMQLTLQTTCAVQTATARRYHSRLLVHAIRMNGTLPYVGRFAAESAEYRCLTEFDGLLYA